MESEDERSPVKKRQKKIERKNEDSPVKIKRREEDSDDNNMKSINGDEELPVQKIESEDKRSPVKKRQKRIKRKDEDSPVKRKRRGEDSDDNNSKSINDDEELPVQMIESEDERSPVNKRQKKIERQDADSLVKRERREEDSDDNNVKSINCDEELPVQKIESEDEKSPVNKRQKKIERQDEDSPVKRKRREEDSDDNNMKSINNDEELPMQKIEKHIGFGDILQDMDDLNEPACMDRILMYLEEIKDEDYFFMELLVARLKDEKITWEQPWYQQSNSLSRPLKSIDNENHPQPFLTDTICKAESDKIQENWNEFRKLYDVPDKLICLARWKNKVKSRLPHTPEEHARRFVVAFLARGLQRTMFQVFRHIMSHYGGSVKGAYSADEEKIMKVCFMHHPNHSVTLLSMVLGREPRGIYKRLQQLFNGKPEKKRIKWTLALASRFLRLLLKYTQVPLEDLKYRKIDKSVWLKLEEKFDQHYIYLQNFWYSSLHVQVFVKENLKINKLRKKVFKSLKSSSYQVWTDIRWKNLVKQFSDGLTHGFLYNLSRRVVCRIPEYLKKPLSEIADQALDKLKNHPCRKRRLKTLQFNEDGDLEAVRHDS